MGRLFYVWYALFLILGWALFTIGRVNDGNLLIMSFHGDALHMVQIVLRMVAGEIPHIDFQTPLGAMAFLPISGLVNLGFGIGKAFAYAPSLLGLFCLPAVYWLGYTRLNSAGALLFGFIFLSLLFAFFHGGLLPSVSVSMYYNNWGWAIAMLVVLLVVLPGPSGRFAFWFEALILGVGMGFLTLSKATYAVFLLPAVILALSTSNDWPKVFASAGIAVVFLALFTIPLGGISYWVAYVSDLLTVANSSIRPQAGMSLAELAVSVGHVSGVLMLLAAVVFLRQARLQREGLVLLALGFGWFLIMYQNWGNDPHWMAFAGLLLFPMSRKVELYNSFGWPLRSAIQVVAVGLLATGLPLTVLQVQSVMLHNGLNSEKFSTTLSINTVKDMRFLAPKQGVVWVETPFEVLSDAIAEKEITRLGDEVLPNCRKDNGLLVDIKAAGQKLGALVETAGKTALYTDWVNALWLFSELKPLPGGAPWYYGGTPGFQNVDYLVVPMCPSGLEVRRMILEEIAADVTLSFSEISRNDIFILLKKNGPIEKP